MDRERQGGNAADSADKSLYTGGRKCRQEGKMNTQEHGAQKRRTLSLNYAGRDKHRAFEKADASPLIPRHELRRLVAAMID